MRGEGFHRFPSPLGTPSSSTLAMKMSGRASSANSASDNGNVAKIRIRDHMDEILEARGYYRKHVAFESDALLRAVSDVMFLSQSRRFVLEKALAVFQETPKARHIRQRLRNEQGQEAPHLQVHMLANLLNVVIEILESANPSITTLRIEPDMELDDLNQRYELMPCDDIHVKPVINPNLSLSIVPLDPKATRRASSCAGRNILLCFNAPSQYDPIYRKQSIDTAGMVQSLLYELLYKDVFKMEDAFQAAEVMLYARFDPRYGKPEVYNKEFGGTAMQALDQFLIPFPYKVAKALDPTAYRNIEYDVWSCEKRPVKNHSPGKSSNSSSQSPNQGSNLGTLSPGTPCVIRDQHLGEIYGRVVRPCMDRRKIEVFLPSHGLPIFVPRKMVMPIKEFPPELVSLWEDAKMLFSDENDNKEHIGDNPEMYSYSSLSANLPDAPPQYNSQDIQSLNIQLTASQDPKWIEKFDFTVPPPHFKAVRPPLDPISQQRVVAELAAAQRSKQQEGQAHYEASLTPHPSSSDCCSWLSGGAGGASTAPSSPHGYSHPADPAVLLSVDQNGNYSSGGGPSSPLPPVQFQPNLGSPVDPTFVLSNPMYHYGIPVYSPLPYDVYNMAGTPQFPFTPLNTPQLPMTPLTGGTLFQFPSSPLPVPSSTPNPMYMDFHGDGRNVFVFPQVKYPCSSPHCD